nr:geminivirus C4 protein [Cressdnaviricota sp.]
MLNMLLSAMNFIKMVLIIYMLWSLLTKKKTSEMNDFLILIIFTQIYNQLNRYQNLLIISRKIKISLNGEN